MESTAKNSFKYDPFHSKSVENNDKRWLRESAASKNYYSIGADQADGSIDQQALTKTAAGPFTVALAREHLEFIADQARSSWKQIAREVEIPESQIAEIGASTVNLREKLLKVLELWFERSSREDDRENSFMFNQLLKVLSDCRLNRIKGKRPD